MGQTQTSPELTPLRKELVVKAYRTASSMSAAAREAGVSPELVYKWRQEDEDFVTAMDEARVEYVDYLRDLVEQRAVGVERPVVYKGELVYRRYPPGHPQHPDYILDDNFEPVPLTETVHSDRMLELLATASVPEIRSSKRAGGPSIGVEVPGEEGKPPTRLVVNFRDPPDWDNVEWDDETGRPKLPPPS